MTREDFVVSVKDNTVYINGNQASGRKDTEKIAWQKAHDLLRRYGLSIAILSEPSRTTRPGTRFWWIQLPDGEEFHIEAKTLTAAREHVRTRLGRKKLPKGTVISEEV